MKRAQTTLASTGFEKYAKTTRRAQFLAEMERAQALVTRFGESFWTSVSSTTVLAPLKPDRQETRVLQAQMDHRRLSRHRRFLELFRSGRGHQTLRPASRNRC